MEETKVIKVAEDVFLAEATQADFAALNADMREADREECRVFGEEDEDIKDWERAWSIHIGGDLIGIIGWKCFSDSTHMSRARMILLMTTNAVWRHKVTYVRQSRRVKDIVFGMLPSWVNEVYSFPMTSYGASIKWQKRLFGFEDRGEIIINGVSHTRLYLHKKEVTK